MTRHLLFVILFLVSSLYGNGVEIKISKIHGLISFSESLVQGEHSVHAFRQLYANATSNNQLSSKDFERLSLAYQAIKTKRIANYPKSNNYYNAVKIESAFVNTLVELQKKLEPFITTAKKGDIEEYFATLALLLPIYERLIWNDNLAKLQAKSDDIRELMAHSHYDDLIARAAKFYGVEPFEVGTIYLCLYPITDGDKTLAFMLGNVESIGVLVNKPKANIAWLLSATIFHEIAHTLFDKRQTLILGYFDTFSTPREETKKIFNESLATALGAGWAFYKITNGLQSNGRWYNNPIYDRQAKAIYPMLVQYMTNNQTIDKNFIATSIDLNLE